MKKISIIMPAYNSKQIIEETIESILNQTFKDFEFIIIDDYSTDGTYEILQKYAEKDNRIKLFRNKKNLGVVKTRNSLLEKVNKDSKYISIIDSDDVAEKERLEKQYKFMEENKDYSVIGTNIKIIDEEGKITGYRKYPKTNEDVAKVILKKSPVAQSSVMIRKEDLDKVGKYNEEFNVAEDYDLWLKFFNAGYKIGNIQKELLRYRISSTQSKSKSLKLTLKNTIKIQEKYIFTKKYFTISNSIYFIAENILYLLPNKFILWLFKRLEYKKGK